ncbi:AraC-type DNA-binding protein [Mycolicibacterium rutilum]|uniref:AraC-type DNA-binding protein n=1 Tax=Mycolicibacterium rutilum TaxID=370526 RepID=A0A1H6JZ03_MYCRU|nr:AraC family transcriptional regulator [Mycolicibacterium rutilum]SEH65245.1 AraC-type DNA-binding protein [Mycolicibacterium rutilum]
MTTIETRKFERSHVEITGPADADEFLEDTYGVALRPSRRLPPRWEGPVLTHTRTTAGSLAIDELYTAGHMDVRSDPLNKVVGIWTAGGQVATACDGTHTEVGAGNIGILAQPHLPYRARFDEARLTAVLLDPAVVAGVAAGLPSSHAPLPIRFTSLQPVDTSAAQAWKSTVSYVRDILLADRSVATPLVVGHACRLLAAVTLATFPNTATSEPTPHDRTDHQPVLLRRAMEFIDANATNDIALADIAEAVHVTPRAVQYMFRRHLETTPLQYLRRLRLHYAHQELLAANRGSDTVTDIAARWGFAHTGRFALLYRQTYGQSPHTTLRG